MSVRYVIHHNGLTCFVPPCFCWTGRSTDGRETTFSDIDVSRIDDAVVSIPLRQWLAAPSATSLDAEGDVEIYDVPLPNGAPRGIRFVVTTSHGFV